MYLDTTGLPPTVVELNQFLADTSSAKRENLIDQLLASDRRADHWISFWQDLLAKNPSLISATLNSTGPFRWFLYESLQDDKPLDRFVTELILMRGSIHEGGSAGFSVAGENDSPMAAKGHILASAFLGIELQCARCHDSPYHSTRQADLYSLGAMLNRSDIKVPASSSVPAEFFEKQLRQSLIEVTLKPNQPVSPQWPFNTATGITDGPEIDRLMFAPEDITGLENYLLGMTNKQAIQQFGALQPRVVPFVRIPAAGRERCDFMLKQVLDAGAMGVIVPHVDTAEQALAVVQACRFPQMENAPDFEPAGKRGVGYRYAARYWGLTPTEYAERADLWPFDRNCLSRCRK